MKLLDSLEDFNLDINVLCFSFPLLYAFFFFYHIVTDNKVSRMWVHTVLSYGEIALNHPKKQPYRGI